MSDYEVDPRFGVPILGTAKQGPNAPGLTANMEIHDSELASIRHLVTAIEARHGSRVNYHDMQRDIVDSFHRLGFVVAVGWWMVEDADTGQPVEGVLVPEVTIRDRTERTDFDHDRKVHEVTRDILGLGQEGVIKSDWEAFRERGRHSHGHGH